MENNNKRNSLYLKALFVTITLILTSVAVFAVENSKIHSVKHSGN